MDSSKKISTLDLTGCKSLGELHQRIRVTFDFPEWYGQNWDAFLDSLRSECEVDRIEIIGENTLPEELKPELVVMHQMLNIGVETCKEYGWNFEFEIIS